MAGGKTYIEVRKFTVKKAFDNKLKAKTATMLKTATEKAIKKNNKFTTNEKEAGDGKKFFVGGSVMDLTMEGSGPKATLGITIVPQVGELPNKMTTVSQKANGKISGINPKRIEGDVQALIDAVWGDFMGKALKIYEALGKK